MERLTVKAATEDEGERLDKVLARHASHLSRARVQALIAAGRVTRAEGAATRSNHRVRAGEDFVILIPPAEEAVPRAQDIPLNIVYEDPHLLVLNKAPGMVVHPGAGNWEGTLVNALLAHCGSGLSGIGGVRRPGIVHRLDKETSGLMVVAKSDAAHRGLSEQLAARSLKRVYEAIVWGNVTPAAGRISANIGRSKTNRQKMAVQAEGVGREAVTDYSVLESFGLIAARVECRLQTGRTHQIRVHMAHIRHWLVGDPLYGHGAISRFLKLHKVDEKTAAALKGFPRQALHAARLEFTHPISENKIALSADLPEDMEKLLRSLRKTAKQKKEGEKK